MSSKYGKTFWAKLRANPVRYAAYLERKRQERAARRVYERQRKQNWRAANPSKAKQMRAANHAVDEALRKSILKRPVVCSSCGSQGDIEAHHHKGYSPEHWLDVVWLCQACHSAQHYPRTA